VFLGLGWSPNQEVHGHFECRLAGIPVEVSVVKQGGELIDSFSKPLLGSKVAEQGDRLSQHQKPVTVTRIVAALVEDPANAGKNLLGRGTKDEVEGSEPHAEI
jgi:hypothetical protein